MGVPGIPHRVTQRGNHTHRQGNWYPIPGLFPVSYDLAGNTTNDGTTTYTYDADGRVCALSGPQGMIGYQYDADGNRIGKGTVTTIATCDITANGYTPITDYVLDQAGAQMTEMAISGTQSTFVHSNVTGSGALLVTFDSTYATHYYLNDALGSRRVQTDAAGIPEQTCQSLPFGDQLFCSGSITSPTEHHYTGKERDNESGLDYFGARYYGSNMGRFMSPDWAAKAEPVPYAKMDNPQSLNLYAYAGNNPVGNVDADGHIYNGSSDSGGYLEGDDPYHQDQQRAAEFAQMVQNGWEATVNQINSEAESEAPAQQQSTTSSTSTTGTTAQDHYVSISYWPTGAGGFGHIGVQVDSDDTQGYSTKDPSVHWWQRLFGAPAARTEDDIAQHTTNGDTATHFYHHISITADQATKMQGAMAARTANPGHYNLLFNNCAGFVESVLRSGGVWAPHAEIFGPPVLYGILSLEH